MNHDPLLLTLTAVPGVCQARLLDKPNMPGWALYDLAFHVKVERDRLAAAFAFCADNPDAPIQVTIRNLTQLAAALEATAEPFPTFTQVESPAGPGTTDAAATDPTERN